MSKDNALVSIGLPVYNGGAYIGEAIKSILSQTYTNIELIICDNASTDATKDICEKYAKKDDRVTYVRNDKNIGAARNFNKTFELSHGEYFKWASHDDILGAQFIEKCVEVLEARSDVVMCVPRIQYIDERGEVLRGQQVRDISIMSDTFLGRMKQFFNHQVSSDDIVYAFFGLIRRGVLGKTGLWQMFVSSEEIIMLDLIWYGKIKQIEDIEFYFRFHSESAFQKNRKPKDRVKWFAPDKKVLFQFPVWYLLTRYIQRVLDRPLSVGEKIKGILLVLFRAVRLWRRYVGDIVKFVLQFRG